MTIISNSAAFRYWAIVKLKFTGEIIAGFDAGMLPVNFRENIKRDVLRLPNFTKRSYIFSFALSRLALIYYLKIIKCIVAWCICNN